MTHCYKAEATYSSSHTIYTIYICEFENDEKELVRSVYAERELILGNS